MKPLIRISTVPITIEYTSKPATFQQSSDPVLRQAAARQRGLSVRTQAPRIQLAQARTQQPKPAAEAPQQRPAAVQIPGDANAEDAFGEVAGVVLPVESLDPLKSAQAYQLEPEYAAAEETQTAQNAQAVGYQMDKTTFDWNVNSRPELEFVPASLEFSIVQYNDVVIEYIGDPNYFPPSANPKHVPDHGKKA